MVKQVALNAWWLRDVAFAATAVVAFATMPTVVWTQQLAPAQQQVVPAQPPSEPQPAPAKEPATPSNPGLVEELGKLLKDSASSIKDTASGLTSKLPSAKDTIEGINSGAKGAADGLTRIAPSLSGQTVSGRAICPPAGNGAPDCKIAAVNLCREKGLKEGRSIDIETAQKCSASSYLSGKGACQTENFVTKAVCQ